MTSFHDKEEIEAMAAEYVLGTLDHDERAKVDAARAHTPLLEAEIVAWEQRFAPMIRNTPDAVPASDMLDRIERSLSSGRVSPLRPDRNKDRSPHTTFWRPLALATSLALIVVLGMTLYLTPISHSNRIAVLQQNAALPAFIVSLNQQGTVLSVHALADAEPPANKNYELWLIPKAAPVPRSLGVLPPENVAQIKLPKLDPALLNNATLAISVEPVGGSPSGSPTGPVVFAGKLVQTNL